MQAAKPANKMAAVREYLKHFPTANSRQIVDGCLRKWGITIRRKQAYNYAKRIEAKAGRVLFVWTNGKTEPIDETTFSYRKIVLPPKHFSDTRCSSPKSFSECPPSPRVTIDDLREIKSLTQRLGQPTIGQLLELMVC